MATDAAPANYQALTHDELYAQLNLGSPEQVEALAGVWRTIEDTIVSLAASLRRDLAVLPSTWTGPASDEYQRRVSAVVTWAESQADQAAAIRTGLTLMAGSLADAQRQAEPGPGATTEWAFDGVLGAALGHQASPAALSQAHDKMVKLIADLAAAYASAERQFWSTAEGIVPGDRTGGGLLLTGLTHLTGGLDHHGHHGQSAPGWPGHFGLEHHHGQFEFAGPVRPLHEVRSAHSAIVPAITAGAGVSALAGAAHQVTRPALEPGGSVHPATLPSPVDAGRPADQPAPPSMLSGGGGGVTGAQPVNSSYASFPGGGLTAGQAAGVSPGLSVHSGWAPDATMSWSTHDHIIWTVDDEAPPAVIGAH
jgi:uncharacterized protein YukE